MKKWWNSYLANNQNMIALAVTILAAVILIQILFVSPCPSMLDYGQYDLFLQEFGLSYTAQERSAEQAHYFTRAVETFRIDRISLTPLLQLSGVHSLVYPVTLVSLVCSVLGISFSTRYLAGVLCAALLYALYIATKALYVWLRGTAFFAGLAFCAVMLCGVYVIPFNSLYVGGMFFVSFWLLSAALLRAFALLRQGDRRVLRLLTPVAATGILFLTSAEQAAILLPVVAALCVYLLLRCKNGPKKQQLAGIGLTALMAFSCIHFFAVDNHIFRQANLYDSFFNGVLVSTENPQQVLVDFRMDLGLVQDVGKTFYEDAESFYLAPSDPKAQEEIFSRLSYPKLLGWYLSHPGSAWRNMSDALKRSTETWQQRFVYVGQTAQDGDPVTRFDWWNLLRSRVFPRSIGLWTLGFLAAMAMGVFLVYRKESVGWLLLALAASGWPMLFVIMFSGGRGSLELPLFTCLSDAMLLYLISGTAYLLLRFSAFLLHAPFSERGKAPVDYPDEAYTVTPVPVFSEKVLPLLRRMAAQSAEALRSKRVFVSATTIAALLVMIFVLFIPRIGAYSNGDFGRMMDAMQLAFTPEEYYNPAEQSITKVIEDYIYLEPYDWSMIRPSRLQLSQTYVSAIMRFLYDTAGIPYSTAIVAALYMLVLVLCFRQFMSTAFRLMGRRAMVVAVGFILIFCGSYNLGWLNSFYGEGIGFVGLTAVVATSLNVLERPRGKPGASLLLYFLAMLTFVCAKAQYVVSLPILITWTVVLAIYHFRRTPMAIARTAVLLICTLAIVCVGGLHVYQKNDETCSPDTLVQGLYNGILMVADDPEEALTELGLDTRLAADRGKHAYQPSSTYFCAPRSEMAEEMIYSRVTTIDYLIWYLKHPTKLLTMLNVAAQASAAPMPDYVLYVGDRTDSPDRRTVDKLGMWKQLRPLLTPNYFFVYVAAFGIIFLSCFWVIFSRKRSPQQRLLTGLFLVIMLCGILQFPLSVIGNGFSDNIKQIYMFREVWDGTLLTLTAVAVTHAEHLKTFIQSFHRKHSKQVLPVTHR